MLWLFSLSVMRLANVGTQVAMTTAGNNINAVTGTGRHDLCLYKSMPQG